MPGIFTRVQNWCGRFFVRNAADPQPPVIQAEGLPPPNFMNRIYAELQAESPPRERSWYSLNFKEALILSENAKRDLIWAGLSAFSVNYAFAYSTDFWETTLAQQLWSTVFVLATAPISAYAASLFFRENFLKCMLSATISSFACLAAIIPWNVFAQVGFDLYTNHGVDDTAANYLAAIFPGPGTAEGPIQTLMTAVLSGLFDPTHTFDPYMFLTDMGPTAYVGGDLWKVVYTALSDLASKSVGGKILSMFSVMGSVLIANYFEIIFTNFAIREWKNRFRNQQQENALPNNTVQTLTNSGSPLHRNEPRGDVEQGFEADEDYGLDTLFGTPTL